MEIEDRRLLMSKAKSLVMLSALATVVALGTACFGMFGGGKQPAEDAEIAACAGLSGQARIDCEAKYRKQ
jgi:hypothetical protein